MSIGESACLHISGAFEPDEAQQFAGALLDLAFDLPRGASSQQRRPESTIGVEMAADLDVLQYRKTLEKLHELEGANEARRCDGLGWAAGDVLACEDDAAGIRCLETGNQIEQRGFARTVRAN